MDEDLLADLEELGGEEDDDFGTDADHETAGSSSRKRTGDQDEHQLDDDENMDFDIEEEEDGADAIAAMEKAQREAHEALLASVKQAEDVKSIIKYHNSKQLKDILKRIEEFTTKGRRPEDNVGRVEDDPEYKTIVHANNMSFEIDNEILVVNKFIRDHYAPKFSELETLVQNPVDYAMTVKLIQNEMDVTRVDLKSLLPAATVMVINVTATTTNGRQLTEKELKNVLDACDIALELDKTRKIILEYVQSRMSFMAPNLTILLGSATAAKLMSLAGGLTSLTKIPACNILVMGSQRQANTGLSSVSMGKHIGLIYSCELVARVPDDFKRKAARLVSAKCALASRVDCARESPDGRLGREFREYIDKQIEKVLQPPPSKKTKALPVPDEGPKKRRGGRRARKMKERLGITDIKKAQNRMAFGQAEEEIGYSTGSTIGLGMIGATETGKVRATQANPKVRATLSKKYRNFQTPSLSNVSGLSSSVAFTPVKGIELQNPELAAQRVKEANDKYFSGGFLNSKKKSTQS